MRHALNYGKNAVLSLIALIVSFALIEILIRSIGHYDADGNFYFLNRQLKPYVFCTQIKKEKIKRLLSSPDNSDDCIRYDSELGWTNKPYCVSINKQHRFNSDGIRTFSHKTLIARKPKQDLLRIAIFGDSFTEGAENGFRATWGYLLEKALRDSGVHAEVLNFGVWGYGMDQAFLRWKAVGKNFLPDIVIFGFQAENLLRNLTLLRSNLYPATDLAYAKPRFTMENDRLRLVNVPVISLEEELSIIENFESWDLAKYDFLVPLDDYRRSSLLESKFISLFFRGIDRLKNPAPNQLFEKRLFEPQGESFKVASGIIKEFKTDVEAAGGKFYVVDLPNDIYVKYYMENHRLPYEELLNNVAEFSPVIRTHEELSLAAKKSGIRKLFQGKILHYSGYTNSIIAEIIKETILPSLTREA